MCSKVLNGHIILTDTSITTILAPEMTYTPKTSDKELKEYTRQIIDSTAMLIKAAEAEIKRLTNETEDTDS